MTIFSALLFFGSAAAALLFILEGAAFFAAGAGFFLAGDDSPFAEERVVRAIVGTILVIHEGCRGIQGVNSAKVSHMPSLHHDASNRDASAKSHLKSIN